MAGVNLLEDPGQLDGVSFDETTDTLTLDGGEIDVGAEGLSAIDAWGGPLKLVVAGEVSLTGSADFDVISCDDLALVLEAGAQLRLVAGGSADAISCVHDAAISGAGSLVIESENKAIRGSQITFTGTLDAEIRSLEGDYVFDSKDPSFLIGGQSYRCLDFVGSLTILDGRLFRPLTQLVVDGVDLLTAEASAYPEGVSFDRATATLTLENAALDTVEATGDLTVALEGENTAGRRDETAVAFRVDGGLTLTGAGSLQLAAWDTAIRADALTVAEGVTLVADVATGASQYHPLGLETETITVGGTDYPVSDWTRQIGRIAVLEGSYLEIPDPLISLTLTDADGNPLDLTNPDALAAQGITLDPVRGLLTLEDASLAGIAAKGGLTLRLSGDSSAEELSLPGGHLVLDGEGALAVAGTVTASTIRFDGPATLRAGGIDTYSLTTLSGQAQAYSPSSGPKLFVDGEWTKMVAPLTTLVVGGADLLGGDTLEGASFDRYTNTLTLEGVALSAPAGGSAIESAGGPLTVVLRGENTITGTGAHRGIYSDGNLTLTGDGSLAVTGVDYGFVTGSNNGLFYSCTLDLGLALTVEAGTSWQDGSFGFDDPAAGASVLYAGGSAADAAPVADDNRLSGTRGKRYLRVERYLAAPAEGEDYLLLSGLTDGRIELAVPADARLTGLSIEGRALAAEDYSYQPGDGAVTLDGGRAATRSPAPLS